MSDYRCQMWSLIQLLLIPGQHWFCPNYPYNLFWSLHVVVKFVLRVLNRKIFNCFMVEFGQVFKCELQWVFNIWSYPCFWMWFSSFLRRFCNFSSFIPRTSLWKSNPIYLQIQEYYIKGAIEVVLPLKHWKITYESPYHRRFYLMFVQNVWQGFLHFHVDWVSKRQYLAHTNFLGDQNVSSIQPTKNQKMSNWDHKNCCSKSDNKRENILIGYELNLVCEKSLVLECSSNLHIASKKEELNLAFERNYKLYYFDSRTKNEKFQSKKKEIGSNDHYSSQITICSVSMLFATFPARSTPRQ
jgi:hypothetical protein